MLSNRRGFLRRLLVLAGIPVSLTASQSGCGTLLYPERRGQKGGRLDWKVVVLNGIGLLFFFIPGVIAFAVDFINGTIYLPDSTPCEPVQHSTNGRTKSERRISTLRKFMIPEDQRDTKGIEKLIAEKTKTTISLDDERCVMEELRSIEEFWNKRDELDRHSLGQTQTNA